MDSSNATDDQEKEHKVRFGGLNWSEEEERSNAGAQRRTQKKIRKKLRKHLLQQQQLRQQQERQRLGKQRMDRQQEAYQYLEFVALSADDAALFGLDYSGAVLRFAKDMGKTIDTLLDQWQDTIVFGQQDTFVNLVLLWRSSAVEKGFFLYGEPIAEGATNAPNEAEEPPTAPTVTRDKKMPWSLLGHKPNDPCSSRYSGSNEQYLSSASEDDQDAQVTGFADMATITASLTEVATSLNRILWATHVQGESVFGLFRLHYKLMKAKAGPDSEEYYGECLEFIGALNVGDVEASDKTAILKWLRESSDTEVDFPAAERVIELTKMLDSFVARLRRPGGDED